MKMVFLSFAFLFSSISVQAQGVRTSQQSQALSSYYLVSNAKTLQEMTNFTKALNLAGYDIAGTNLKNAYVEIVATELEIQKLAQRGFPGLQKIVRVARTRALDPQYLNPAKVEAALKDLNQKYPQHTRLEKIGTSLLGKPIYALLISTTPNTRTAAYHTKPSMLFDGLHHAREVMTPEVVMDVAHFALQGLTQRSQGTEFLQRWNLWIVPMLNVDGSDIVWTKNSFWRKNARSDGDRMHGVDINRNYSFGWNKCRGSSPSPIAQDYRGASAGSEPETQALMNLAQQIRPVAYVSYHSFGELTLFPYGCQGVFTGENQLISQVANEVSQILPADDNRGNYRPGTPWQILYAVDGDSMSYMFGEFGSVAMTFEINQDFQPPYALKAPTVAKHRRAWTYLLNRYDQGMLKLRVFDGKTRTPATQAIISVSNIPFLQGEKPYRTNGMGHFFKVLIPGSYTLTAQLPDGRKSQINVNMKAGGIQADLVIP